MEKLLKILEVIKLFVLLPIKISNGQKKQAYRQIKEAMMSANLL